MPRPDDPADSASGPSSESEAAYLERVRQAAIELTSRKREVAEAEALFASVLGEAHEAGCSWEALAVAAQLDSPNAARLRAQRARRAGEEQVGLGITEAAERLGVSRQTIYDWIKDGRLRMTKAGSGRTRVLLDDPPDTGH